VPNWKQFAQEVEIFIATAHGEKDDRTKAYIFLNLAGREAIEKEKSFIYAVLSEDGTVRDEAESCESIEVLKRKFAEILRPSWKCHYGKAQIQHPNRERRGIISVICS